MADKYAAFFIALVTSRHIVPAYPPPPLATLSLQPTPPLYAPLMDEEPGLIPLLYTSIWRVGARIYIYIRGAYIEGTAGVIFFPNPSPPLLDFAFPRSMFPFCFVLINSSVMCLQDETRSVSQDHKESRALVGSRTVKGARSICSPQFPPLPAKFRRLFASFFFHPPPPRICRLTALLHGLS